MQNSLHMICQVIRNDINNDFVKGLIGLEQDLDNDGDKDLVLEHVGYLSGSEGVKDVIYINDNNRFHPD